MQGDRKVLVSDSNTLPNYDAGLFAQPAYSEIAASVAGLDMALLVAAMGSDAGMSISPMIAQVLRRKGIVTLGFAVMPSDCAGQLRQQLAQAGLRELRQHVDALMPMFESSNASDNKPVARLLASQEEASRTFFRLCRAVIVTDRHIGSIL